MKKLRIAIIGAGGIAAKLHLPELHELSERCEIALIAGRRESRLKRLSEMFPVAAFTTSYDAVISDDSIDGVIVATPHPQHVEWGVRALQAGKHVMMQKPLCANLEEANQFVAAVEASNQIAMCLPHFAPPIYAMKAAIERGDIGRVSGARARTSHGGPEVYYREVRAIFGEVDDEDLWFFDANRADAGALFDMGVYAVSQMVALLGTISQVRAIVETFDKPTTLEDNAVLLLKAQSGALGVAETSWCDPGRTWEASVHGTAGKLTVASGRAEVSQWVPLAYDSDHAPIEERALSTAGFAQNSHAHWFDCIEAGQQPPLSNAHAARHVTEVLLAGLQAGRSGQAVEIQSLATR